MRKHNTLQQPPITIRSPQISELGHINTLCHQSKAVHGYPQAWLDSWRQATDLTAANLTTDINFVAELDGNVVGFCNCPVTEDVFSGRFFIAPNVMRCGVGTQLWHAVIHAARAKGLRWLRWKADPNSVTFYQKLGARQIGESPSKIFPDQNLPVMEYLLIKPL